MCDAKLLWNAQIAPLKELCRNLFGKNLDVPYAGSRTKFARRKKSSFSELMLRLGNLKSRKSQISGNPFDCVHSLGLWSRSINPPLQSLVNQDFSQTFERLFSKEEIWKQNPPRLKCSKMPRIWKEKSAEMSCVHFTRILGLVWHYFIKFEFWGIPSKCLENRRIFPGASLILGPWGSPRVAFQSEILYDYLIKTFSFNNCRILYRGNQLHQVF